MFPGYGGFSGGLGSFGGGDPRQRLPPWLQNLPQGGQGMPDIGPVFNGPPVQGAAQMLGGRPGQGFGPGGQNMGLRGPGMVAGGGMAQMRTSPLPGGGPASAGPPMQGIEQLLAAQGKLPDQGPAAGPQRGKRDKKRREIGMPPGLL